MKKGRQKSKKGQVTLFIILAILIVGIIGGFAFYRYGVAKVPTRFEPIEQYFLDCIKVRLEEGASLLGQRGGFMSLPVFEPGSEEWPTSNVLGFVGDSIPYWFYVSGNGIMKEKVPTISDMESGLAGYLEDTLPLCDFSDFFDKGYDVSLDVTKASVDIRESKITADVSADLIMAFDEDKAEASSHATEITSKLGKFYNLALRVYNKEKQETFLENLTVDMLYLYAPTTDSEISCSPKIWLLENVSQELKAAFENNFLFLSPNARQKYFVLDVSTDEDVRFLYNKEWPTKIYAPSDNGMLVAKPLGTQQGLGVLGFCFLPYHFVYDINFPILVQIYDEKEFFQFPVNVIVRGNRPRQALEGTAVEIKEESACRYKNTLGTVATYDSSLNPIEADIQFKCFSETCNVGGTKISGDEAELQALFPQCVNGIVIASKEGYVNAEEIVSSNQEFEADLILDKLYRLNVNLKISGAARGVSALVYFESGKNSQAVYWPEQKTVELSEGFYNVSVQVYSNSSITLPETKTHKCVEVPEPGLLGLFGKTNEKCFDMTIPEQKIQNAIIGGGKTEEYFIASQLQSSSIVEINVPETQAPKSIEDIQKIYDEIERAKISVEIK
jgi:hypothetical protein